MLSDIMQRFLANNSTEKTDRILKSSRLENQIFNELISENQDLQNVQAEGQKQLSSFDSLTKDVFSAFYSLSLRPNDDDTLTDKARQFNKTIMDDLLSDSEYNTLKTICEGKELPAFEASSEFSEKILGKLPELLKAAGGNSDTFNVIDKLSEQAENLNEQLQSLTEANQSSPDQSTSDKISKTADKLNNKLNQIENLNKAISDNLLTGGPMFKAAVSDAARSAEEKAKEISDTIKAWGNGSGNMGNTTVNKELLKKVRQNDKLRLIAKFLGRYKEIISDKRKNSFSYGLGEKYDVTNGNNIDLCLSSEIALLATPETQPLFIRKYQQQALKQYRKMKRISKGMGDIIVCLDESSSMDSVIEWAKAFALALMDIACRDKRRFALIHFASADEIKVDIFEPGRYTLDDMIQSAEHFFDGGTNFEVPLNEAVNLINTDFENADVMFITDGECAISQSFSERLSEIKKAIKFRITGILLDKADLTAGQSLIPFCDTIYRSSKLTENGIAESILLKRS